MIQNSKEGKKNIQKNARPLFRIQQKPLLPAGPSRRYPPQRSSWQSWAAARLPTCPWRPQGSHVRYMLAIYLKNRRLKATSKGTSCTPPNKLVCPEGFRWSLLTQRLIRDCANSQRFPRPRGAQPCFKQQRPSRFLELHEFTFQIKMAMGCYGSTKETQKYLLSRQTATKTRKTPDISSFGLTPSILFISDERRAAFKAALNIVT